MPTSAPIRILAPAKQKGDLFTRLVSDLFLALGYDAPRLNIHKAGREIDVQAHHRTEPRIVVAECKATAKPIGGDEVNKFAGAVQAERRRNAGKDLVAYYVSLSGFTETALEQEKDFEEAPRFVLLDGKRVAGELVHGRIVVSPGKALERAGRVASGHPDLFPDDPPQLLAHEIGWIWAVRFRRNSQATHVALVHADGELLAPDLASQVLASDRSIKGDLHRLTYLPPPTPQPTQEARLEEARQAYFRYLAAECGELELEGLPADQEIGTRRLRLESLFVPLHLEAIKARGDKGEEEDEEEDEEEEEDERQQSKEVERLIVGTALECRARLAILALPGGGKTTLLKRLAVAYAFPERRSDLGDGLPNQEWFPLFLRCRQLGSRAGEPITELLGQVGIWAELGDLADAFRSLCHSILREGRVLLLVDGLDEIAEPALRIAFVTRLRTFLSTYPGVDVVVTSREAGFRVVAGALSAHCDHYRIADFDQGDIERLTVAWHREVVGDRKEVEQQARALAESIWETDRVRRLAVNPLLLTTLLLVRRWVGQLPSRRSVLYEKAIEVLLMTWNLQGFEPLDLHEVKPQLAFLAWQMMEEGDQRISEPRLKEILREARRQMPEVLAYARMGVDEFVERVERRSGVLVLSGQILEGGRLVSIYEFRHLTFQEYLAAQALVDGNYPGRSDQDTLVSKLGPRVDHEDWKEVIPLVAALAGRKSAPLIEFLTERLKAADSIYSETLRSRANLLAQCLLDEIQISPNLLERALEAIARRTEEGCESAVYSLASSRAGSILRQIIWSSLAGDSQDLSVLLRAWRVFCCAEMKESYDTPLDPRRLEAMWWSKKADPCARAMVLMSIMFLTYRARFRQRPRQEGFENFVPFAVEAIQSSEAWEQLAGAWVLLWLSGGVNPQMVPSIVHPLLQVLARVRHPAVEEFILRALEGMPLITSSLIWSASKLDENIIDQIRVRFTKWKDLQPAAALVVLFYISSEEERKRLPSLAKELVSRDEIPRGLRELLEYLGEDEKAVLHGLEGEVWPSRP